MTPERRALLHQAGDHSYCYRARCEHAPPGPLDHPVTLKALARRRYETGEYGHAHLALRRADVDRLPRSRRLGDVGGWEEWTGRTDPAHLTGIPVVIDDELPPRRWELRDNSTKRVITAGVVDVEPGS